MAFRAQGPKVQETFGSRRKLILRRLAICLRATVRARDPAIKTMNYVRAPPKKRAEQALPPLTETRSAAFPACLDGFDDVDGGPERGVYIQMRGVEQVRFRRRFQGGHRPLGVALVPALDVGQDLGLVDAMSRLLQLEGAAARRLPSVPLPEAAGPSIAMIMKDRPRGRASGRRSRESSSR